MHKSCRESNIAATDFVLPNIKAQDMVEHGFDETGSVGGGVEAGRPPRRESQVPGKACSRQETWMGVRELASLNSLHTDDSRPESYTCI